MSAEQQEQHTYIEQYDGHVIVYDQGRTSWSAYVDDLPTCFAAAETFEECQRLIREGIVVYLDASRHHGPHSSNVAAS